MMPDWRKYLYLDDDKLIAQCRQEIARGSGPGGQKRNKTSNAVRLLHLPTGIAVRAQESRSQKSNKNYAIDRLRMEIAIQLRAPFDLTDFVEISVKNPVSVAIILDALHDSNYVIADAAAKLNQSTSRLSKQICSQPGLLEEVNRQRRLVGLRAIRAGS